MPLEDGLNGIRRDTLARVEKSERARNLWIAAAAVIEAACLITFILLADFGERLHLLLFVGTLLVYGTLAMGILALGAFTQSWCLRILCAIELLNDERGGDGTCDVPNPDRTGGPQS